MLITGRTCLGLSGFVLLIACAGACSRNGAAEHPGPTPTEHPSAAPSPGSSSDSGLRGGALAKAVRDYVERQAAKNHGQLEVYDPVARKQLHLDLVRVMDNHLAALGNGVYFACADFKNRANRLYDIDVFFKQTPSGLRAADVLVHKVDGQPRYYWVEEHGKWQQQAAVSVWNRLFGRARECK